MSNRHQDSNEARISFHDEAKRKLSRGRIVKAVVAGFAVCAITLPALALPPPTTVTGAAIAAITVSFRVAPPAGSMVSCSLALISNDQRAPADSNSVSAPVSGSTATCQIVMVYSWPLTTPSSDTMTIAYSVQGPVQSSSGLVDIIPMPTSGTHATYKIAIFQ